MNTNSKHINPFDKISGSASLAKPKVILLLFAGIALIALILALSSYALTSVLSDYVLGSAFPQADGDNLGGVRINGNNLSINSSTGILSATINVSQSIAHVGVFTLQATTNLITATETFIRWKPALSATESSSQGLVHAASNAIPAGSLFTCNDTSGVYNINLQIALTVGTNQSRSFHVACHRPVLSP